MTRPQWKEGRYGYTRLCAGGTILLAGHSLTTPWGCVVSGDLIGRPETRHKTMREAQNEGERLLRASVQAIVEALGGRVEWERKASK
jgi:hypothetical protein